MSPSTKAVMAGIHEVPGASSHYDRGFGGGLGLGTPVVSYAPLPMFMMSFPLSIIEVYGEFCRCAARY